MYQQIKTNDKKIMKRTITRNVLTKKLGNFISVENLPSRNGQRKAPNQFELKFENGRVFQSYDSLIGVMMNSGDICFTDRHDYSNTTSLHCKNWCHIDTRTRREGLKSGKFIGII